MVGEVVNCRRNIRYSLLTYHGRLSPSADGWRRGPQPNFPIMLTIDEVYDSSAPWDQGADDFKDNPDAVARKAR